MPQSYPVPAGEKWTLYDTAAEQVIHRNRDWPRTDLMAVEGLAENLVYLRQTPVPVIPSVDERFYSLVTTESFDLVAEEVHYTRQAVKRPVDEIIEIVENLEAEKLSQIVRLEKEAVQTRMMVALLLNTVYASQQPPVRFRALADQYRADAVKIFQNRDRRTEIITQVQANQEPDLNSGWVEQ